MIALVTGGARSGKSAYAEDLAMSLGAPRWYLATMRASDAESRRRVARHLAQRVGKGFETVEVADGVPRLEGGTALLEDLPNLLASRLYDPVDYSENDAAAVCNGILRDVRALAACCDDLVVVTNEVGSDGVRYDPGTEAFVDSLGRLGCSIAAFSDLVVEVVAGCPIEAKRA